MKAAAVSSHTAVRVCASSNAMSGVAVGSGTSVGSRVTVGSSVGVSVGSRATPTGVVGASVGSADVPSPPDANSATIIPNSAIISAPITHTSGLDRLDRGPVRAMIGLPDPGVPKTTGVRSRGSLNVKKPVSLPAAPSIAAANAWANAVTLGNRSPARLDSARPSTVITASGTSGRSTFTGVGCSLKCLNISAGVFSAP